MKKIKINSIWNTSEYEEFKDISYFFAFQNYVQIYLKDNKYIIKELTWLINKLFNIERKVLRTKENIYYCDLNVENLKKILEFFNNNKINYCIINNKKNTILFENFNDLNNYRNFKNIEHEEKYLELITEIQKDTQKILNNVRRIRKGDYVVLYDQIDNKFLYVKLEDEYDHRLTNNDFETKTMDYKEYTVISENSLLYKKLNKRFLNDEIKIESLTNNFSYIVKEIFDKKEKELIVKEKKSNNLQKETPKNYVKLYHFGSWYKAYNDDAKVLAYITDYKLFEDNYTLQPAVGFPEYALEKVITNLANNRISYHLISDGEKIRDYGKENNYLRFVKGDLPYSYVVNGEKRQKEIKGNFKVKFEDEPIEEFEVGENINQEAELVQLILKHDVGETIILNDEKIEIIEKNIN